MIRILKDTDLPTLEANINKIIHKEWNMKLKDVKIKSHHYKDFYDDGRICNQWLEYIAIIIFE